MFCVNTKNEKLEINDQSLDSPLVGQPSPAFEVDAESFVAIASGQRSHGRFVTIHIYGTQETGASIMLKLNDDVLFGFGKAELCPEADAKLENVARVIAAFPGRKVMIEGLSSKGCPQANRRFSKKRAESVKSWLLNEKGISADITTEV